VSHLPHPEAHMREPRRCFRVGRPRVTRTPSQSRPSDHPFQHQVTTPMPTWTYSCGACLFCQMGWESESDGAPCPPRSQPRIPPVSRPHTHQPTFTCPYPSLNSATCACVQCRHYRMRVAGNTLEKSVGAAVVDHEKAARREREREREFRLLNRLRHWHLQ
jgi:hypothetical protein